MIEPEIIFKGIKRTLAAESSDVTVWMLEKLVKDFPRFEPAYETLGNLYNEMGNKEKALFCYEKIARLSPSDLSHKIRLASYTYLEHGNAGKALKIYESILKEQPENISVHHAMGNIYFLTSQLEKAIDCYERILSIDHTDQKAFEYLERLKKRLQQAKEKIPCEVLYGMAQQMIQENDIQGAVKKLTEVIERVSDFAPAHNDLGVLYFSLGEKEKALKHYERSVALYPKNTTFLKNLGDFYIAEHDMFNDAYKCYVSALDLRPDDKEALFSAGYSALSLNKQGAARKFFNRILRSDFWNLMANDAIEYLFTYPSKKINGRASDYLKVIHLNRSNPDHAIEKCLQCIGQYPDFIPFFNFIASAYAEKKDEEKAIGYFEMAKRVQPQRLIFQKAQADFFIQMGYRQDLAYETYLNLIEQYPGDIELLLTLGSLCCSLKRCHEAENFYQRIIKIDPENEVAKRALSSLGHVCQKIGVMS